MGREGEQLVGRAQEISALDGLLEGISGGATGVVLLTGEPGIGKRPPEAPILVACSFRTGQASSALVATIDAADRSGQVARLELGPLSTDEATQLLGASDVARHLRLYLESGDNPFYLLQLDRAGVDGQVRARDDGLDASAGGSSKSPGWSSTGGPTPRSPPTCS